MSTTNEKQHTPASRRRLRIGLSLWVISYLPLPVLCAALLHHAGKLTSAKSTSDFIAVFWTVQILIGFVGLFLAGREVIDAARSQGWRRLPRNVWDQLAGRPIAEPSE